jgi:hypothetical protein
MRVRLSDLVARLVAEQTGATILTFVLWFPVLIGFGGLVLDVGNWFEHRRHLQLQADAAVLAAGGDAGVPCSDAAIAQRARDYGGEVFNAQVGGTPADRVHMKINSRTYHGQTSPVDESVDERGPCESSMIDVKLTETDLPWFLDAASVDFINSHARVEFRRFGQAKGILPIAAPESNPRAARVIFVDEENGQEIASRALTRRGVSNGLSVWDNSDEPLPVEIDADHVGVRVALGGRSSTVCGEPLVECYDAGSVNGVVHIRGWTTAGGNPKEPRAKHVRLVPGGDCADAYFASDSCTFGVLAEVDWRGDDPTNVGAKVDARVGNKTYPLSYDATANEWSSATSIPLDAAAGPVNVTLAWQANANATICKTHGKCDGSFGVVQRAFGGSIQRSGALELVQVSEGGVSGANTFERCSQDLADCTHDLVVRIGITPNLQNAQSEADEPVPLRVVGSGSNGQSLDCGPDAPNFKDELASGCASAHLYGPNTGTSCPPNANALWVSQPPWTCIATQTGNATNQVPAGMNKRILGAEKPASCTSPNNWDAFPDIDWDDDPRVVQAFVTPFGAFEGSGNLVIPIVDFATFYVTGWTGQGTGYDNPCEGEGGDDPVPGDDPGTIVGHFVKYVETLNAGDASDELCDMSEVGRCLAVLTQ